MSDASVNSEDLIVREEGRAGFLTLNRPRALNALTLGMIRTLEKQYVKWAEAPRIYGIVLDAVPGRAFCGGGDIRALTEGAGADPDGALQFFREEYQHNWTLERFTKPNVSLIDGIVMGGGVGISLYGTHRVAGEKMVFAMPETGIGFFPDIGGGWFLSRFPGETGMYLGLTGNSIGRADAYYLGIITHCVDTGDFDAIRKGMIEGDPIDPLLDSLHSHPGAGELAALRPAIDRIFGSGSVEAILALLDAETGPHADWARQTAATIRQRAPLALKVTHRQISEARHKTSLKDELIVEYRLVRRMLFHPDLREGVRSQIIDKDRSPKWQPAALGDVTDQLVDTCFEPLPEDELQLVDRWTLID